MPFDGRIASFLLGASLWVGHGMCICLALVDIAGWPNHFQDTVQWCWGMQLGVGHSVSDFPF